MRLRRVGKIATGFGSMIFSRIVAGSMVRRSGRRRSRVQRMCGTSDRRSTQVDFPDQLCKAWGKKRYKECQDLGGHGNRSWGNLLSLYRFAIYVNTPQLLNVRPKYAGTSIEHLESDQQLAALQFNNKIDMAVMMKMSRELNIGTVRREYEAILKRRMKKLDGRVDHDALAGIINLLHEQNLPRSSIRNGAIRKDTTLTFTRQGPDLFANVNNVDLGYVRSNLLCEAILDMYIGQQPTSEKAKNMVSTWVKKTVNKFVFHGSLQNSHTQQMITWPDIGAICKRVQKDVSIKVELAGRSMQGFVDQHRQNIYNHRLLQRVGV